MIYGQNLDVFVIAVMWSLIAGLVLCLALVAYLQRNDPDTSMLWAVGMASEGEPLLLDHPLTDELPVTPREHSRLAYQTFRAAAPTIDHIGDANY